jgi:hypothetical protein
VAYAKAHQSTADALLMTFIQEALITTYTEVDPWSWLGTSGPIAWGAVGFVCVEYLASRFALLEIIR